VRNRTGWGPRLIAGELGMAHQTVWKILKRHGHSRKPTAAREVAHRYEWPCPGDLLHMDTSRYARFSTPGHKVTGDRTTTGARKREAPGYDFIHAIIDDHSRLAYAEIHKDEKAATVTGFMQRALGFYADHGIAPTRLMTDNAFTYVHNRSLKELLDQHGIRHLRTRPYRPQTNGKIERFHQTMATEWAYGMTYGSARARARALPYWITHYNERRPHSALAGKAPISRVRSEPL
jgi:transposase InsO family protein